MNIGNIRDCEDGVRRIFCRLRKRYVALTPEETVRQSFVSWLIDYMHYPESLMANEVTIKTNGLCRRCDTVVYASDGTPLMVIEYKAPHISISQSTFDQIARYNLRLKARWLIVTNGRKHYCCRLCDEEMTYSFVQDVPMYGELLR